MKANNSNKVEFIHCYTKWDDLNNLFVLDGTIMNLTSIFDAFDKNLNISYDILTYQPDMTISVLYNIKQKNNTSIYRFALDSSIDILFLIIETLSKGNISFSVKNADDKEYSSYTFKINNEKAPYNYQTFISLFNQLMDEQIIDYDNWKFFSSYFGLLQFDIPKTHPKTMESYNLIIEKSHLKQIHYSDCFDNKSNVILDKNFIQKFNEIKNIKLKQSVYYDTILDNTMDLFMAILNIYFHMNPGGIIKRCKNCNEYFIVDKITTNYCNRYTNKKSCRFINISNKKIEYLNNNEAQMLYKKIYNSHRNAFKRHPSIASEQRLNNFKRKNKIYSMKVKKGDVSLDEYLQWLKNGGE